MKTTIYMKLVWYFTGLVFITCLTSGLLFFIILGRPVAKEAHQLVRNHVRFIAAQTESLLSEGVKIDALNDFVTRVSDSYRMTVAIFDADYRRITGTSGKSPDHRVIQPEMIRQVREKGIFVQSGHLSGQTIYLVPLNGHPGGLHYLYINRTASVSGALPWFVSGLGIMCLFLVLGIYPLARNFTRPIRRLSTGLEQMASGNFKKTENGPARSDELGILEATFEKMAGSVNEMMASKKQLLADISHELRSPLGRMEVSLELLSEADKDPKSAARHIQMLETEIRFMTGLIRSLSEYSKINLPEFKLTLNRTAPQELLRDIFSRNLSIMEKHEYQFDFNIQNPLPDILLDRERITRVIQNFLDNARQYCRPGGTIILGAAALSGTVRFFVSDSGKGLPATEQGRIFQPLFRADSSRNRHTGGIGLGLAISRRIIEQHGGRIGYSRENNQTVFSFELDEYSK
ncbi:MAG: HAMP domain-containing histidine kinase [Desulfobacterales bacterium]|nr:HAMP domain-containing histidine kinase [Desulfobacterales bacterium]